MVGFSGIAATILVAAALTTSDKSSAGAPCGDTLRNSSKTAHGAPWIAGPGNDKLYFTGLTTRAKSEPGLRNSL